MNPHNRIVTIPVKLFAGIRESCNTTLRAIARRLRPATSSDPPNESSAPSVPDGGPVGQPLTRPTPAEESGRGREWICKRCGDVHASDPTSCRNCGFTVFEPGPPLGASDERTVPPDTPASTDVVAAVADREGVQPTDLGAPLYDAIDPDALDTLVAESDGNGTIVFVYHGYEVTVTVGGDVVVRDAVVRDGS